MSTPSIRPRRDFDPNPDLHPRLKSLIRYRYKYRNQYNNRYILVYSVIEQNDINDPNDKGVSKSKAIWTMYDDDDENFQEDHIDLSEDFYKMINEGKWEIEGNGVYVIVK